MKTSSSRSSLGLRLVVLGLLTFPCSAAHARDRVELRDRLKVLWESLDTFSFSCDEHLLDSAGGRLQPAAIRYDFAHKQGGFWAFKSSSSDGRTFQEVASDGRRTYEAIPFRPENTRTDRVEVRSQEGDPETYPGTSFTLLWLILPGGKPLYRYSTTKPSSTVHATLPARKPALSGSL